MAQAKITGRHEDSKQATIILPEPPQVPQPRVNHGWNRAWSLERVAWLPWSADQDSLHDAVNRITDCQADKTRNPPAPFHPKAKSP